MPEPPDRLTADAVTRQLLADHPLFAGLYEWEMARFCAIGEQLAYKPGRTIVEEGSASDAIYIVLSGTVHVSKGGSGGRPLATLAGGDFFGEMSFLDEHARSASVIASDQCEIFRLPNKALRDLADSNPQGMIKVLETIVRTLSDRLRHMNETLSSVGMLADWVAKSML